MGLESIRIRAWANWRCYILVEGNARAGAWDMVTVQTPMPFVFLMYSPLSPGSLESTHHSIITYESTTSSFHPAVCGSNNVFNDR